MRVLIVERARFHQFISSRIGSEADADDLLQDSLLRALEKGSSLRRGERVVAWFYRILRNAMADHFRERGKRDRMHDRIWRESDDGTAAPVMPADWDAALCKCFRGLLPSLNPRYARILRQIDLGGEEKTTVARAMGLSVASFDVVLHRARHALRHRLKVFCGACSREHCLQCACEAAADKRARSGQSEKLNVGIPVVE